MIQIDAIAIWKFVLTDQALSEIIAVISSLAALLLALSFLLSKIAPGQWLPCPVKSRSKYLCEVWFLQYGVFWISVMVSIIIFEWYKSFDRIHYAVVLGALVSPLYLQPVFWPSLTGDEKQGLLQRYSFKANLWIGIFGFIGNYWYTHYFYNVLKASYTFKSWDINGVPFPMILATHFYFTFYHTLSNMALRKVRTTFASSAYRTVFECALIFTMSYVTAFMEALTISGFPCYSFEDRRMAWVLGSAFYGIYFLVSFPMFFRLDEGAARFTWFQAAVESLATGMLVLQLLDAVRIALGMDFVLALNRPCKLDPDLTCPPFRGQLC